MKFKVGDKVRVRKDLEIDETYGENIFVEEMKYLWGEVVTISKVCEAGQYRLVEDETGCCWTDEMFESVTPDDMPDDTYVERDYRPDVRFPAFQEDNVNHPQRYKHGEIETLDIIRMSLTPEEFQGFLKGNVLKYQLRAPFKHATPEEDYKKAKYYYDEYREVAE